MCREPTFVVEWFENAARSKATGRTVTIRFYAELNDFLPKEQRQVLFAAPLAEDATVKHLVESLGVPHTEVELILVSGEATDLSRCVDPGDRISVYPRLRRLVVGGQMTEGRSLGAGTRFVLDGHLGKLASYLRLLGFDTDYVNDREDKVLATIAEAENRILLTRDRALLMRRQVQQGMFVREQDPEQQTIEVVCRFDLFGQVTPFTRCLHCNTVLSPVRKEEILDRLLPKTRRYYDEFRICPTCDQIYWRGSHWEHMRGLLDRLNEACAGLPLAQTTEQGMS